MTKSALLLYPPIFILHRTIMAVPTALPAALGLPPSPVLHVLVVLGVISVLLGVVFLIALNDNLSSKLPPTLKAYITFAYACFMKPHDKATGNQQDALESFYKAQASVYDATRTRLLRGREDMLSLAAAQLRLKSEKGELPAKPVWVDVSAPSLAIFIVNKHCSWGRTDRWWYRS